MAGTIGFISVYRRVAIVYRSASAYFAVKLPNLPCNGIFEVRLLFLGGLGEPGKRTLRWFQCVSRSYLKSCTRRSTYALDTASDHEANRIKDYYVLSHSSHLVPPMPLTVVNFGSNVRPQSSCSSLAVRGVTISFTTRARAGRAIAVPRYGLVERGCIRLKLRWSHEEGKAGVTSTSMMQTINVENGIRQVFTSSFALLHP